MDAYSLKRLNIDKFEYSEPGVEDYSRGDPNGQDDDGQTLLHKYVLNPNFDAQVMQNIINNGASLELRNKKGKTAFLLAVLNRKKNAMEVLIKNGAEVHVKDNRGNNALHLIAVPEFNCHLETVKDFNFDDTYYILERLLKKGVDVNAQNLVNRETPLMWAARGTHLKIVKMLLAFGADVRLSSLMWKTCLHFAVFYDNLNDVSVSRRKNNDHAILSELVRNKACIHCFDMYQTSPLFYTLLPDIPNNDSFAKELIKNSALLHWHKKIQFFPRINPQSNRLETDRTASEYTDMYYEEIDKMKRHILPGNADEEKNEMERRYLPHGSNLCKFALEGVTEDDLRQTPGIKDDVLKIILTESFPLYLDLILSKLGRQFLLQKGMSLTIYARRNDEVISLNYYNVSQICGLLRDIDIFNLLSTFSDQLI